MKEEALKEYFKHLCEAYCIAQKQQKQIKNKLKKIRDDELVMEHHAWLQHKAALSREIDGIIDEVSDKGYTITITTRQEVIYFINYFSTRYHHDVANVINLEEVALKNYPAKDKLCADFYKAYCLQDGKKMQELNKKVS